MFGWYLIEIQHGYIILVYTLNWSCGMHGTDHGFCIEYYEDAVERISQVNNSCWKNRGHYVMLVCWRCQKPSICRNLELFIYPTVRLVKLQSLGLIGPCTVSLDSIPRSLSWSFKFSKIVTTNFLRQDLVYVIGTLKTRRQQIFSNTKLSWWLLGI